MRHTATKSRRLASGPGGGAIDFPAFYSYAYPMPTGFAAARISPEAAYYDENLGEFLLPYDAVRLAKQSRRHAHDLFWKARIAPLLNSVIGTGLRSSARLGNLDNLGPCETHWIRLN